MSKNNGEHYFTIHYSRMVHEWSLKDDCLLFSNRLSLLHNSIDGLKMRTEGYQWYQKNKLGSDKIICVHPWNKYTVTESLEFCLGKVENIWVVNSKSDKTGKPLKVRAKERIMERGCPTTTSFDQYMEMRTSCWLLEEVKDEEGNVDYLCDCPVGMKVCNIFNVWQLFMFAYNT